MKEELKDKITSVILFLIIIGIFSALVVFCIIAVQEFFGENQELAFAEASEMVYMLIILTQF